ncbi:MAG: hypothetical protein K2H26_06735 [Ruminococcus sp.]|nr:hypothetical protein [Ruminococcus sp.]
MNNKETEFLGKRMTQLHEKNGIKSLQAMMEYIRICSHRRLRSKCI